ncbi:MAG TPA: hypothetical protein VL574_03735 [Stellaceae bacterium]|jgi:hypothetical protein|nr:hypothetical protein [Stellaceae bacterium]
MSDLKAAIERLVRAVDGLENAVAERHPGQADQTDLAAELAASRAECARLLALTNGVAERLDGAIATVKSALEG